MVLGTTDLIYKSRFPHFLDQKLYLWLCSHKSNLYVVRISV